MSNENKIKLRGAPRLKPGEPQIDFVSIRDDCCAQLQSKIFECYMNSVASPSWTTFLDVTIEEVCNYLSDIKIDPEELLYHWKSFRSRHPGAAKKLTADEIDATLRHTLPSKVKDV